MTGTFNTEKGFNKSGIISNRKLFEMRIDFIRVSDWLWGEMNLEMNPFSRINIFGARSGDLLIQSNGLTKRIQIHDPNLKLQTHCNIKRNSKKKWKELWTEHNERRNSKMKSKPITLNAVQWIRSQLKFEEENVNLKIAWICSLKAIRKLNEQNCDIIIM